MRILIAGLGAIGQRHARNLRALCGTDLELLAFRRRRLPHVVTEALERDDSRNVETELGLTVFEDLGEALAAKPGAVFVCTPSSQHLDIAQRGAEAGCDLFIEKPLAHSMDGVEQLRRTVSARDVVVLVGCQWRYHPCVRWLRDTLNEGRVGVVRRAEIDYGEYLPDWHPYEDYRTSYAARAELGGGVVLTQIHDYDLAWWLFGPVRSVTASGGRRSDLQIDVEDTVDARLDGRVPVRVRQTLAARPPRRTVTVFSDRGTLAVDLLTARVTADVSGIAPPAFNGYERNEMFLEEARHFLGCVERRERPSVPLSDGISVLEIALGVKEAMVTGQPVSMSRSPAA